MKGDSSMIQDFIAFDVHSHLNHGAKKETIETPIYNPRIDWLKTKADSVNVSKMFCSTFAGVLHTDDVAEENLYMNRLSKDNEWLYQWVVIEPRNKETYLQASTMLKDKKCVGIKIHPYSHNFTLSEFGDDIFSFAAEFNTTVQIHPEENIKSVVEFANKYAKMNIILAHLGSVEHVEAIFEAKNKNIYTDTSGCASTNNYVVEYAVSKIGADRIMFGTDTYDAGFQRGRIDYALISEEDKKKILRKNAEILFEKNL